MASDAPTGQSYSRKHQAYINRLVPAWITEDFQPVADLLDELRTTRPVSAWSPGRDELPDERLRAMHDIWRSHAAGLALPPALKCDPDAYGELARLMMVLDFREDGRSLSYRHYGGELALHSGTNWQGRTTVDMATFSEYSILFATSYLASSVLREPLYTELISSPMFVSTTWCRYLMPYVDDDGKVVSFACANLPIPGLPTWTAVRGRAQATEVRAASRAGSGLGAADGLLQSERNVRELLKNAPIAVMVVGVTSRLTHFVNEPMASLVGYGMESLAAADPSMIFSDPSAFRNAFESNGTDDSRRNDELTLHRRDGSDRWVVMFIRPIVFDSSECLVFWFYDISKRKAAEAARLSAERQKEETIEQLIKAQDELRSLAERDSLTNLPNRRHFYNVAAHEFERARRNASGLSLLMIDIDLFKVVNDEYGHPAGDEVLRRVASALDSGRRRSDVLARVGGEEFLILLPDTAASGAVAAAEKLRSAVAATGIAWRDVVLNVTISIGVSVLTAGDQDIDAVVQRADDALYEAKKTGRDRVVLHAV